MSTGKVDEAAVIGTYADQALASYSDSLAGAEALLAKLNDLVESPSKSSLEAARTAWLAARKPYGQTEVHRFYEGPIDNADTGPEGRALGGPRHGAGGVRLGARAAAHSGNRGGRSPGSHAEVQ
jgi:hypothetical protein